jgi:hypothetical protein
MNNNAILDELRRRGLGDKPEFKELERRYTPQTIQPTPQQLDQSVAESKQQVEVAIDNNMTLAELRAQNKQKNKKTGGDPAIPPMMIPNPFGPDPRSQMESVKLISKTAEEVAVFNKVEEFQKNPAATAEKYKDDPVVDYLKQSPKSSVFYSTINTKFDAHRADELEYISKLPENKRKEYYRSKGVISLNDQLGDKRQYMLYSGMLGTLKNMELDQSIERLKKNQYETINGFSPLKERDIAIVRDKVFLAEEMTERGIMTKNDAFWKYIGQNVTKGILDMVRYGGEIALSGGMLKNGGIANPTTHLGRIGYAGGLAALNPFTTGSYATSRMTDKLNVDQKGNIYIEKEGKGAVSATLLGFAENTKDMWTEQQGEVLGELLGKFGKAVLGKLPAGVASTITKAQGLTKPFYDWLEKAKISGMLPELGEEYIDKVMTPVLMLDDEYRNKDETYVRRVANAMIPDPEELLIQTLIFAIIPAGAGSFSLARKGFGTKAYQPEAREVAKEDIDPQLTDEEEKELAALEEEFKNKTNKTNKEDVASPEQSTDDLYEKALAGDTTALEQLVAQIQQLNLPTYDQLLERAQNGDQDAASAIQEGKYRQETPTAPQVKTNVPSDPTATSIEYGETQTPEQRPMPGDGTLFGDLKPKPKFATKAPQMPPSVKIQAQKMADDISARVFINLENGQFVVSTQMTDGTVTAVNPTIKEVKEPKQKDPERDRRKREAKAAILADEAYQLNLQSQSELDIALALPEKINFGQMTGDALQATEGDPSLRKMVGKDGAGKPFDQLSEDMPEHFKDADFLSDPHKFFAFIRSHKQGKQGDFDKKALKAALSAAEKNGNTDLLKQWAVFDMIDRGMDDADIQEVLDGIDKEFANVGESTEIPQEIQEDAGQPEETGTGEEETGIVKVDDNFDDFFDFKEADTYGQSNTIISKEQYEQAKKDMRPDKLQSGISPQQIKSAIQIGLYHLEAGTRAFADWSNAMISDLGEAIQPQLMEIWRKAGAIYKKNLSSPSSEAALPSGGAVGVDIPTIKAKIKAAFQHITDDQINAVFALWEANAATQDITLEQWIQSNIADVRREMILSKISNVLYQSRHAAESSNYSDQEQIEIYRMCNQFAFQYVRKNRHDIRTDPSDVASEAFMMVTRQKKYDGEQLKMAVGARVKAAYQKLVTGGIQKVDKDGTGKPIWRIDPSQRAASIDIEDESGSRVFEITTHDQYIFEETEKLFNALSALHERNKSWFEATLADTYALAREKGVSPQAVDIQKRYGQAFIAEFMETGKAPEPGKRGRPTDKVSPPRQKKKLNAGVLYQLGEKENTKSESFKKWFKKSKVVNKDGSPRVVYHGTIYEFNEFEMRDDSHGVPAAYFAGSPQAAESYAAMDYNDYDPEYFPARIIPAYLSIQNPLIIDESEQRVTFKDFLKIAKDAYEKGHDGIIVYNALDDHGARFTEKGVNFADLGNKEALETDLFIVFSPNQIKSVFNQGTFSRKSGNILYQSSGPAPTFYSKLRQVLETMQPKMTAEQFNGWIAKQGIKSEELEWSGLGNITDPITKEEALSILDENNITIEEVTLGGNATENKIIWNSRFRGIDLFGTEYKITKISDTNYRLLVEYQDGGFSDENFESISEAREWSQNNASESEKEANVNPENGKPTKFESYTLPGGKNYRELLLKLPDTVLSFAEWAKNTFVFFYANQLISDRGLAGFLAMRNEWDSYLRSMKIPKSEQFIVERDEKNKGKFALINPQGAAIEWNLTLDDAYDRAQSYIKVTGSGTFKSSHFDETNILAHIRFNDRTTTDGKRALHIEEIQSDWHQAGRKRGYAGKKTVFKSYYKTEDGQIIPVGYGSTKQEALDAAGGWLHLNSVKIEVMEEKAEEHDGVPDAPFKKTWHELAFKRILRYAVENGYDVITWTTGEQQAERYDLSKQLDHIEYEPVEDPSGTYDFRAYDTQKRLVFSEEEISLDKINELVGKEIAEKIKTNQGRSMAKERPYRPASMILEGLDLKVGGEGMKGFYDQMLPSFVNKYVKKWGGRVGTIEIEVGQKQFTISQEGVYGRWRVRNGDQLLKSFATRDEAIKYISTLKIQKYVGPTMTLTELTQFREYIQDKNSNDENYQKTQADLHVISQQMMNGLSFAEAVAMAPNLPAETAERLGGKLVETEYKNTTAVHQLEITDAMAASVMGGQPMFQDKKAAVEFAKDGRAIIYGFQSADVSSLVHETAHIFRRLLRPDMLALAEQELGVKDGNWDVPSEERFARGFERYLRDGKAPTKGLKSIFKAFRQWLASIYRTLKGSPLAETISPNLKKVFDSLLVKEAKESKSGLLDTLTDQERDELDAAEKKFTEKTRNQLNMGLDPELFVLAGKIGSLYIKAGYRTFSAWAGQVKLRLGDLPADILKTIYLELHDKHKGLDPEEVINQAIMVLLSAQKTSKSPDDLPKDTSVTDANTEKEILDAVKTLSGITTGRNADTDEEREILGLDGIPSPQRKKWLTTLQDAKNAGLSSQSLRLADAINANPRPLSDTETAGFIIKKAELKREYNQIMAEIDAEKDPESLSWLEVKRARVEMEYDALTLALEKAGTEQGRALNARKMAVDEELSLLQIKTKAKAKKGATLTPEEAARFERLHKELEQTRTALKDLQDRMDKLESERFVKTRAAQRIKRMTAQERRFDFEATLNRTKQLMQEGCIN